MTMGAADGAVAVTVRGARKCYTTDQWILDGLNMTVPSASIYALLGASGCGKTTLLTCILGLRRLNAGSVRVMGWRPGEAGSGIPGPRIGYMPQELGLSEGYSIDETMKYFGKVAGMSEQLIEQRSTELLNLLDIPSKTRLIGGLSGGQKQRVSLAVTLLHSPSLLILDEPTVGVDPVLRQSIWDYLVELTRTHRTTVIITTHYIEEARQADRVGLMRQGRLLDEDAPDNMMAKNACDSLEDVFLKLSVRQEAVAEVGADRDSNHANQVEDVVVMDAKDDIHLVEVQSNAKSAAIKPRSNVLACLWWGMLYYARYKAVTGYVLCMPVFCLLMYLLAIGNDPKGLAVAVVNEDSPSRCLAGVPPFPADCAATTPRELSCRFLALVQKSFQHELVPYSDLESAREAVLHGQAWGVIHFPANFSHYMTNRQLAAQDATDEDLDGSEFDVHLDMSNVLIGQLLQNGLFLTTLRFHDEMQAGCNLNTKFSAVPIAEMDPIFGSREPSFRDFSLPGCLLIMMFFPAIFYSTAGLMEDKLNGVTKRGIAAGVTQMEMFTARAILDVGMTIVVTAILLVTAFGLFPFHNNGSFVVLALLLFLQGTVGLCVGYFVASLSENYFTATFFGMGFFVACTFTSGIVWPTEAMYWLLRHAVHFSPMQMSVEAARSVIFQGSRPVDVGLGFLAAICWIVGLYSITVYVLRRHQRAS